MAGIDYRSCDVCGGKTFYDADLDYRLGTKDRPLFGHEKVRDCEYGLGYLGDWAVICTECAKTHKCVIVPCEAGES